MNMNFLLPEARDIMRSAEAMPGGVFIYKADEDEQVIYLNDIVLDIFSCPNIEEFRQLTGGSFKGMVYPDDLDSVERSISEQIDSDLRHLDYVEYRIKRPDGSIRWVDDYGRLAETSDAGRVFIVFIRDITGIKHAREENVRRAEVIENLSDEYGTICLLELDTGVIRPYKLKSMHLPQIAEGLRAESAHDNSALEWETLQKIYTDRCVLEEDRERYLSETSKSRIAERLKTESSYTVDYRCMNNEGGFIYTQMTVSSSGKGSHAVIGYRDVTGQVMRGQRELAEKMRAEQELSFQKSANEAKSAFLFNISHDIRTPMNAIIGYTDLALTHPDDSEKLTEELDKVSSAARQLLSMIDEVLEMSSLDSGRIELHIAPRGIKEELLAVRDMFTVAAAGKSLTLETDIDVPNEKVMMDAGRFRRIIANLVSNAVKFTPDGGKVKITARRTASNGGALSEYQFAVLDNGVGMSRELMERVFLPFERAESSTRSGSPGTGLGLTIAKSLTELLGGRIEVSSEKGKGSRFTVFLPFESTGEKVTEDVHSGKMYSQMPTAHGERRILLVEDIEINRLLAEKVLRKAGFIVESVPDGTDAVEAVRNSSESYFDLILMDIQMPVMNGYEATRAIRALDRFDIKKMPIIALSANARPEDKRMSIESGMNGHIAKPFDIAGLINTVNDHIDKNNE